MASYSVSNWASYSRRLSESQHARARAVGDAANLRAGNHGPDEIPMRPVVAFLERVVKLAVIVEHRDLGPRQRRVARLSDPLRAAASGDARDDADIVDAPTIGKVVHDLLPCVRLHSEAILHVSSKALPRVLRN